MSDVNITIVDGGSNTSLTVPSSKVQVKIGCLLTGIGETAVVNQIVPATTVAQLQSAFVGGKLVESCALLTEAGGTALAIGVPVVTKGVSTSVIAYDDGGSTSVVTVTLDADNGAWDDYYVRLRCTHGGTRGTAGIKFRISLDAGRNEGPEIALGTAVTYEIPNTGITINFAAGTLVADDYWQFYTTAPAPDSAGLSAAIDAFVASSYALSGVGSGHIVATVNGTLAATLQGYLGGSPDGSGGIAADHVYTRWLVDTVDATAPTAWGGAGQTEAAWMAALESSFSGVSAKRVATGCGWYNMPSPVSNTAAGRPSYRRPASWAMNCRQAAIPLSRLSSRVLDDALVQVIRDDVNDPLDGFVYHDERVTPGLAAARLGTLRTWIGKPGWFVDQPYLLAPAGSDYSLMPYGLLVDEACRLVYAAGLLYVNRDLPSQPNGTLDEFTRLRVASDLAKGVQQTMVNAGLLSGVVVATQEGWNVRDTGSLPVSVSLYKNAYVFNVNLTVGYGSAVGG